ncbi:hypothetical protein F5X68DRAFT_275535 [Plectosphaerella plurivora]|uniref:AAA+ ATPase domain-containing protein n=1 Tax=Plectosphaerella plurivora TaxID=936078 RepID=A0A9P8VB00_9PEZI|nr:hypothetical protein F5X68DRAFT_275535 [Plectosphaerella plurivora]
MAETSSSSGIKVVEAAQPPMNDVPHPPPKPESAKTPTMTPDNAPKEASAEKSSEGANRPPIKLVDTGVDGKGQRLLHPAPATRRPKPEDMIPTARKCRWEDFINRFSETEPIHVVDALLASDELSRDTINEAARRAESQLFRPADYEMQSRISKIYTNKERIQRVKVHSSVLLQIFSRVTGYAWGDHSYTFMRPFQYLIYFHEKFRDELLRLEGELAADPAASVSAAAPDKTTDDTLAVSHLRGYIEFAEAEILPDYQRFREPESESRPASGKIRFDDLWYLMQPGDLVYLPEKTVKKYLAKTADARVKSCSTLSHNSAMQQNIWRLYSAFIPYAQYTATVDTNEDRPEYIAHLYHLDYDGVVYSPSCYEFQINHFEGEKDIRELEFYPMRYANRAEEVLEKAKEIGTQFMNCVAQWHMSYDGWTLITDPVGQPLTDARGDLQVPPQHIDSEVIVDFAEAISTNPKFNTWSGLEPRTGQVYLSETDNAPDLVAVWSDRSRSKLLSVCREVIVGADDIEQLEQERYAKLDPYLDHNRNPDRKPEGDDLALLPRRVFVYSLKDAMFLPVDVRYMTSLETKGNGFDRLQLPENHKRMIQSATSAHMRRKHIERLIKKTGSSERLLTQDFIQGKGMGLIIMLHGEPGIGKTATAEAVAHTFRRPLFPISCGDLGSVWAAEKKLEVIFRLADLWDCILLLDEADVLLSARTPTDNFERNGLVSVFLRKLEYYKGILFLTTNRIGKIDQALSSRIHLVLHYSRLGRREIESVFRINIERLRQAERQQAEASGQQALVVVESDILRFAADHCDAHPKGKGAWNGRQIRNAFVVAAALARAESEEEPAEVQPQLRYSHFKQVETVMGDFVQFRASVLGKNDSQLALLNEERDDDYEGTWAAATAAAAEAEDEKRKAKTGHEHFMATVPRGGQPPTPTSTVYSSPAPRPRMTFIPQNHQHYVAEGVRAQPVMAASSAVAMGYHAMPQFEPHGQPPPLPPQRSQSQSQGGGAWVDMNMLYGSSRS